MKHRIFTVLALLTVSTGSPSSVQPKSAEVSTTDSARFALSGESINVINSRTLAMDLNSTV